MIEHVKTSSRHCKWVCKDKMKINLSINKEGKHNETYWVTNSKAIEWLLTQRQLNEN
jgi:hypothetical protein